MQTSETHKTVEQSVDMRERAIALASLGYRVFRLQPDGKQPVEKNFPSVATSDPAIVRAMWTDALGGPSDHNIGIATGQGIVAVDYDVKDGRPGLDWRNFHEAKGMPDSGRTITPSGGEHLFLRTPERVVIGSSVQKLAPGVDTRGHNGYVVGPGSRLTGDGDGPANREGSRPWHGVHEYRWSELKPAVELGEVPDWFLPELLAKSSFRNSPSELTPLVELDTEEAIARATHYLVNEAPEAIEGDGGDITTYRVAAKLREFGIGEDVALTLLQEHWNEDKAHPPWDEDALARKVENAFRYGQDAPGSASPLADFDKHEITGMPPAALASMQPYNPDWPSPTPARQRDPSTLPDRLFLFEGMFARSTVSALVAPSGAGKTQLLMQVALATATGRDDICALTPVEQANVWIWNQEDDIEELDKRRYAAMLAFGITDEQTGGRLFVDSGVESKLMLAKRDDKGAIRPTKHVPALIEAMKRRKVGLAIFDPLVEFHEANENDNVEMAAVAGILRRIAVETGAAVVFGVHDRKPDSANSNGHAGNQHAMRGASSVQGVTRAILTLYEMSADDAKALKISDEDRHRYIRLDGAKNNLALAGAPPQWLKREGQPLREGGSEVGVLRPVTMTAVRPRVVVEIDRHELVARAMELLELHDGKPHRWTKVRECLADEKVWTADQYLSDITWKRWMSDEAPVTVPTARGLLTIEKGGERSAVHVKLTPDAAGVYALADGPEV